MSADLPSSKISYSEFLARESAEPYFIEMIRRLRELGEAHYRPDKDKIFAAFSYHNLANLRVVIVGQDPYKDAAAEGLAFSCANNRLKPSLANIFQELRSTHPNVTLTTTSLVNWARQGVLLLNTYLTTPIQAKSDHGSIGWEIFAQRLFRYLNENTSGVIFVFLGKFAQRYAMHINEFRHKKIILSHPSPYSANISFLGSRLFRRIDDILARNGHKINWDT